MKLWSAVSNSSRASDKPPHTAEFNCDDELCSYLASGSEVVATAI